MRLAEQLQQDAENLRTLEDSTEDNFLDQRASDAADLETELDKLRIVVGVQETIALDPLLPSDKKGLH